MVSTPRSPWAEAGRKWIAINDRRPQPTEREQRPLAEAN